MVGALLAYPFVLAAARPAGFFAILLIGLAALLAIDVAFAELGYDALNQDMFSSDTGRLYQLAGSLASSLVSGAAMAFALQHLGWRTRDPGLGDGVALCVLGIWWAVAVVLPFLVVGALVGGGLAYFAAEDLRVYVLAAVGVVLVPALLYVTLRLFFAGPQTLVSGRVQLYRTWPSTRGRFWAVLGCALVLLLAAFALAAGFSVLTVILPQPDWLSSWADALNPINALHLLVMELTLFLPSYYFSVGQVFLFDRLTNREVAI
ncbi:MAG TPA: hypothetical protein VM915_10615 [Verrucomicrobiae bacterium]|nr:hypothetical protein [Verrucomicrobiae bacterium]